MKRVVLWLCVLCASMPLAVPAVAAPWAEVVDATANLYRVDDKLYRSQQPLAANRAGLEALGIRTVVNLRFFNRGEDAAVFRHSRIQTLNHPLPTWHLTPENVAGALWLIEQGQRQGPVLVHCYHGADRTGLVSAMYRVVYQGWPLAEARREMQQGGFGYHSVWRNIDRFFTEGNVAAIKAELARLRLQPPTQNGAFRLPESPADAHALAVF